MGDVEVTILGQHYKIKGDVPDNYIRQLAEFVDRKIAEIYSKSPNIAPLKASILASLNIADELFRYKEEQERLTRDIQEKTETLVRLFD
ncbi:MAG TPA: cell division protein ZapA [Nitrospirae bacterium]|nr:cell division protein ZapA [Nitrospirota bacterium]